MVKSHEKALDLLQSYKKLEPYEDETKQIFTEFVKDYVPGDAQASQIFKAAIELYVPPEWDVSQLSPSFLKRYIHYRIKQGPETDHAMEKLSQDISDSEASAHSLGERLGAAGTRYYSFLEDAAKVQEKEDLRLAKAAIATQNLEKKQEDGEDVEFDEFYNAYLGIDENLSVPASYERHNISEVVFEFAVERIESDDGQDVDDDSAQWKLKWKIKDGLVGTEVRGDTALPTLASNGDIKLELIEQFMSKRPARIAHKRDELFKTMRTLGSNQKDVIQNKTLLERYKTQYEYLNQTINASKAHNRDDNINRIRQDLRSSPSQTMYTDLEAGQ